MSDEAGEPKLAEDRIAAGLAAQRLPGPMRPKRFFQSAQTQLRNGAFAILLDGRPAKTPAAA